MARITGGALGWLRRQLGWGAALPAPTGEPMGVGPALGLLESLVCDGVVHCALPAASAVQAGRQEIGGVPARNAFGRPVVEQEGAGPRGTIALATGMSLAGMRTAAWLAGDDLGDVRDALRDAADRLTPLLVHVADDGGAAVHAGCHALADVPAFVVAPRDGAHAVDLTLVARRLTELALVPGVVVSPTQRLDPVPLPGPAEVRAWLGPPHEEIPAPTRAQQILFGPRRRRAFRWFDPDHPVATATVRGPDEAARGRRSRELFFWDHVGPLAAEALAARALETGRPLGTVDPYRLEDATLVVIAAGTDARVARAAADLLREDGHRVGVLGLPWLHPLPHRAIAEAIAARPRQAVVVAERVLGPGAPLLSALRATIAGAAPWIGAAGDVVRLERLVAACEAVRGPARPPSLRLERPTAGPTGLPRHDALAHTVRGAYPDLIADRVPAPRALRTPGVAVAVAAHAAEVPPDALRTLAGVLQGLHGGVVRGEAWHPEPVAWYGRVQVSAADFADPGPHAPVDTVIVLLDDPGDLGHPLRHVLPGGSLILALADPRPEVWWLLPPAWRDNIRRHSLQVHLVDGGLAQALALLQDLESAPPEPLDWPALGRRRLSEPPLAPILRHIARSRPTHDSLPRFWGELAEPRREGHTDPMPDPLSAGGAVPALASALEPDPVGAPQLPALDPAACTACGRCWTACPDSALGATVVGIAPLLDAAADMAGFEGAAAGAVRRQHPHLANRLAKDIEKRGAEVLDRAALDAAWTWLADKLGIDGEIRARQDAAFARTAAVVATLTPVVSTPFFRQPEAHERGAGELFVLAMDPRACQGCALCVHSCPEDALSAGPRGPDDADAARERWALWEALPDTPTRTLSRAVADPGIGRMAGALLSRHVALAQSGGGVSEPGSGERLAVRWVTACAEEHGQRALSDTLEAMGAHVALAPHVERLSHGVDGLGRSRFAILFARGPLSEWAGRYPRHPYHAPMTVEPTQRGVELARGIVQGLMADHVDLVRALRSAAAPHEDFESLSWADLSPAERRGCPPLLFVGDRTSVGDLGLGWLTRLLSSALPVKVVMLDGRDRLDAAPEPALVAMAHRTAFVLATSVAAPDHLARGVADALRFDGPALLHIHAPSPRRLGHPAERTLDVARAALHARVHILFHYDPGGAGLFGQRAHLADNPALAADHGDMDAVTWARGLERFAAHFEDDRPDEAIRAFAEGRRGVWQTLRELTGDVSAFTDPIRARVRAEVRREHEAALAALGAERDQAGSAARASIEAGLGDRLTDRLLVLAGYAEPEP